MQTWADRRRIFVGCAAVALGLGLASLASGQDGADAAKPAEKPERPDFPPFAEVSKDYTKVVSTADGTAGLWTLFRRDKDAQLLAELPRGYENQRYFFAMTVASGDTWAGLQGADMYVYWKRFDKRLALIAPNTETRSSGDQESRSSVSRVFTDSVILDVPIVAMGPSGQPVIDLDAMLIGQGAKFFGRQGTGLNANLARIENAKAFPENLEIAFEAPGANGRLMTLHYSIRVVPNNPSYKPREADERVGYFTTTYRDLAKFDNQDKWVRYINRWHLEKADPKLRMSPPKSPIVFYLEHTIPVRYRRYVRDGILYWNKAFEKVGIVDAIEVRVQDKTTGAHMDKDPEDSRYNFIRWVSNDISTAIGPSRAHPLTGEILDADIVLTDGWIRAFFSMSADYLPQVATEGFTPDTFAWLEQNPQWDPRLRLVPPAQRELEMAKRAARGIQRFGGAPIAMGDAMDPAADELGGLSERLSQPTGMCAASMGKAMEMAVMGMALDVLGMLDQDVTPGEGGDKEDPADDDKKPAKKDKPELLDGIPEWFIGPLLADLTAHEVGHTLGLRHNFKASSAYSLAQINSAEFKGQKPLGSSVMDYNALPNINLDPNQIQGDYGMIDIGPYDIWAIEYGYTMDDPKKVLARVGEPEHAYATDEDTWGPDPLARRRDLGKYPIEFARSRMQLVDKLRSKILDNYVKDGQSWSRARRGYMLTLRLQTDALSTMANWVGGAFVSRDKKGDANARLPIEVVPAEQQREALRFVIDNAFRDESFGLTPDLLNKMSVDKWWDQGGMNEIYEDPTWPVHERVLGIQASALTMIMNPTTIQRVFDNEFRIPADQDALTLPELMQTIHDAIWSELAAKPDKSFSARNPMISSLRRNLQREHMERLIDLAGPSGLLGAARKPVSNLAVYQLRELEKKIGTALNDSAARMDAYTLSHLSEAQVRIQKALDAQYIYNANQMGGSSVLRFMQPADNPFNHGATPPGAPSNEN